ncbi:hypothetical protein AB1N83_004564 [Pleurotus pulmonarius]
MILSFTTNYSANMQVLHYSCQAFACCCCCFKPPMEALLQPISVPQRVLWFLMSGFLSVKLMSIMFPKFGILLTCLGRALCVGNSVCISRHAGRRPVEA